MTNLELVILYKNILKISTSHHVQIDSEEVAPIFQSSDSLKHDSLTTYSSDTLTLSTARIKDSTVLFDNVNYKEPEEGLCRDTYSTLHPSAMTCFSVGEGNGLTSSNKDAGECEDNVLETIINNSELHESKKKEESSRLFKSAPVLMDRFLPKLKDTSVIDLTLHNDIDTFSRKEDDITVEETESFYEETVEKRKRGTWTPAPRKYLKKQCTEVDKDIG